MITYGDGLADIDLHALLDHHHTHGAAATITAVHPPARFGEVRFKGDRVEGFAEKAQTSEGWINGGFMVCEPRILSRLKSDAAILEIEGLEALARAGDLSAYRHVGFWQCMDTLRDKNSAQRDVGPEPRAVEKLVMTCACRLALQFHRPPACRFATDVPP